MRRVRLALDGGAHLIPVFVRHLDVGDHEVRPLLVEHRERLVPVVRVDDAIACVLEDRRRVPVDEIAVVGEQDDALGARGHAEGAQHFARLKRHPEKAREPRRTSRVAVALVRRNEHERNAGRVLANLERVTAGQPAGDERRRGLGLARQEPPELVVRARVKRLVPGGHEGLCESFAEDGGGRCDDDVHEGGRVARQSSRGKTRVARGDRVPPKKNRPPGDDRRAAQGVWVSGV